MRLRNAFRFFSSNKKKRKTEKEDEKNDKMNSLTFYCQFFIVFCSSMRFRFDSLMRMKDFIYLIWRYCLWCSYFITFSIDMRFFSAAITHNEWMGDIIIEIINKYWLQFLLSILLSFRPSWLWFYYYFHLVHLKRHVILE